MQAASKITSALKEKGYQLLFESPTNQIFCVMQNEQLERFAEKAAYSFWEKYDEDHTVIRLATDWATSEQEVEALIQNL